MNKLSVATCNVRGLKQDKKRHNVFKWFREKNCDIIFMQETHCHLRRDEYKWSKEWDGQSIWSRGTNRSRGVTVLFNRKYKYDIRNVVTDYNGRYILFDLYINETEYRVINVYTPNSEYESRFFNKLKDWIKPDVENLIAGDFNCTLESEADRENCTNSSDIGQIDIKNIMHEYDLEDVFRRRYPERREFSWRCGKKRSRIDYWLISSSLDNQVDHIQHIPCPFTDHSFVNMIFRTSNTEHGKGVWKMNIQTIKSKLFQQVFQKWWKEWKNRITEYRDVKLWWDITKKKIKEISIWCSCKLSEDRNKEVFYLEHKQKN